MFYVFSYTPTIDDTEAAPHILDMHLTKGIVHQIDILFQSGCQHQEFVQLFDADMQIWPTNRGEKIRGDATSISYRDFYELDKGNDLLQAAIWTTLTTGFKEIVIQIGILPKDIIQPLSFDSLVKSIAGT